MVQFYESYCSAAIVASLKQRLHDYENQSIEIVPSMRRQLEKNEDINIVTSIRRQIFEEDIRQSMLAKISWTHNRTIFSRCKLEEERPLYIQFNVANAI